MMPLLGRSLTHQRGAELLHAWIAAMASNDCNALGNLGPRVGAE